MDGVITSPPYLNAIDYMRGHKLSLVWMGYTISELRGIRGGNVGAEAGVRADHTESNAQVIRAMGKLRTLPTRFRGMIERYVDDLEKVIGEIARVLIRGGRAVIVIGDCTIRETYIRNSSAVRLVAAGHC